MDPHIDTGAPGINVLGQIYDHLLRYDVAGNLAPHLAESWEIVDDRTYEFHLRQGVTFHDGSAFDAEDVVASFARMADPAIGAGAFSTATNLEVEVPDPYTVRIVLSEPSAAFPHQLTHRFFHMVSADDVESGFDFATNANGTGPFKLLSHEAGFQTELVRNDDYWQEGLPYLDGFVFTPRGEETARLNALLSGEADLIATLPWQDLDRIGADENYRVYTYPSGVWSVIELNVSVPPFDDVRVRQALNYVVDKQEILDLCCGGFYSIMDSAVTADEDSIYFGEDQRGFYAPDHDRALSLLREAGYETPADVPPIQLTVFTEHATHRVFGELILQELLDFGFDASILPTDSATYTAARAAGDFQALANITTYPSYNPPNLLDIYHSELGARYAALVGFGNDELDDLLEQANATLDDEERATLLRQADAIIFREAPMVFSHWSVGTFADVSSLQGFEVIPGRGLLSTLRFNEVWFDDTQG